MKIWNKWHKYSYFGCPWWWVYVWEWNTISFFLYIC